jgi:phosphoserine phosphatase
MMPLGIEAEATSDGVPPLEMAPGDLLVLLTDGFYEYQKHDRELFGQERLGDVVRQNHHRTAKELLGELMQAIQTFADGAPQQDDMTAVIIRRLPG